MSELRNLAAKLAACDAGSLPDHVLRTARLCLLDTLGCGLYGSTLPEGQQVLAALGQLAPGNIPVWGGPVLLSRSDCALALGTLCHLRELDDVHYSITHPGAVVIPAAYAAAWGQEKTLAAILMAVVCGYEAMVRIAKGCGYLAHRRRGWHATATLGAFGAAAACGKLLGLDEQTMIWALGIAGSRTGGTWAFKADGAMTKRLHPGLAARDGVTAGYLARAGITGPEYVLEAEDGGFFRVACEDWSLAELVRNWGQDWAVSEVEFKWYAACKAVHAPLEAAMNIFGRARYKTADIVAVNVGVNSSAQSMASGLYRRDSVASAQLSIPYGVALGLSGRQGGAQDFELQTIDDDWLFALAGKVQVYVSPQMEEIRQQQRKSAAQIEVVYRDGSSECEEVRDAKGHLGNPLTERMIKDKFLSLADGALGEEQARAVCARVLDGSLTMPVEQIFAVPD